MIGRRRVALALLLFVAALPAAAHVNSPHLYVEKEVGGYPLMIIVHMPPAVPGEADVIVRILDRDPDDEVRVLVREIPPQGEEHAPAWIAGRPVPEDPESRLAPLPLMVYGLWNAEVRVEGARGAGNVRVPIPARVAPPRKMGAGLVAALAVLVAILFASCFETLRGIGSDGQRLEADPRSTADRWRGLVLGTLGVLSFGGFLGFTWNTWAMFDGLAQRRSVPSLSSRLRTLGGPMVAGDRLPLELTVIGRDRRPITDVARDHGKAMHAIIVREPDADYFLHLHPRPSGPGTFAFDWTPPEAGTYKIFADVMFRSGETETLTKSVEIGPGRSVTGAPTDDPDDAARVVTVPRDPGARRDELGDGLMMLWTAPGTLKAGDFNRLEFEVTDASGVPVDGLDPLAGAAGQMTVLRDDLNVFARVYPAGNLGASTDAATGAAAGSLPSRLSFPYGFPEPGVYRLFVQIRHGGRNYVGVFDARVVG